METSTKPVTTFVDFPLTRGDTFRRTFRFGWWADEEKTVKEYYDLTGATASAQVRTKADSADILATFTATVLDQTEIKGGVSVYLPATQSAKLNKNCSFDVQLTLDNGDVWTPIAGYFLITKDVTR